MSAVTKELKSEALGHSFFDSIRTEWGGEDRLIVLRHHAKLWRDLKARNGWNEVQDIPGFITSLQSLYDQGYSVSDISAFFGVSKERGRVWFNNCGIKRRDTHGSRARIWSDKLNRFTAIHPTYLKEKVAEARATKAQQKILAEDHGQALVADRDVTLVRDLTRSLGRPAYNIELLEALGYHTDLRYPYGYAAVASRWGRTEAKGRIRTSVKQAWDALYACAGVERSLGTGRTARALRSRNKYDDETVLEARRLRGEGHKYKQISSALGMPNVMSSRQLIVGPRLNGDGVPPTNPTVETSGAPVPHAIWCARAVDVVGDVHGCHDALLELLAMLGYKRTRGEWRHPHGRTLIFLGDLTDYGPDSLGVLRTVMALNRDGVAFSVMGNHDNKLMRALRGNPVQVGRGLSSTLAQLSDISSAERRHILMFLSLMFHSLMFRVGEWVPRVGVMPNPSPYPKLVVAHAGLDRDQLRSQLSRGLWSRVLYGNVDKDVTDNKGYYHRDHAWTSEYDDGEFFCVYGHTFVSAPDLRGNTINIDTGPAYGGGLTAFRWPEREAVTFFTDHNYREDGP